MENKNQVDKKKRAQVQQRLTIRKGTLHTEGPVCKVQTEAIE